jgi:hypothetical protein
MNVALSMAVLLTLGQAGADDVSKEDQKRLQDARLAFVKQAAAKYEFTHNGRKAELIETPLLRWNNTVVEEQDALLFMWTLDGRPVVAAQFFAQKQWWLHEFQSMTFGKNEGAFSVRTDGAEFWSPKAGGQAEVSLPPIKPASAAARRLQQMKEIAESFTGDDHVVTEGGAKSTYALRVLPRPIYRYRDVPGYLDGAIFAMAQDNNPEILITIECPEGDDAKYRVGMTRMTSYEIEIQRDGKEVLRLAREICPSTDRSSTYFMRFVDRDKAKEIPDEAAPPQE